MMKNNLLHYHIGEWSAIWRRWRSFFLPTSYEVGPHHGRNIMGIKNVFQYHRNIMLPFVKYRNKAFSSFWCHKTALL
jgi:hypothetical protein